MLWRLNSTKGNKIRLNKNKGVKNQTEFDDATNWFRETDGSALVLLLCVAHLHFAISGLLI